MKDNDSFTQYDTMSLETQRNDEISLLERHDLLTGEPRYIEDEIRNSRFAMYLGGLAGVLCLVGLILSWILYHRDRKSVTLWHAIFMTLGMFVGFLIASWGASTGQQIGRGQSVDNGLSLVAFLLAILFASYFAAAAVYLKIYRYVHFCRITNWKSDTDEWNRHMPDKWDLAKGISRDSRLLWWIIGISAICAFLFAFCAYAIWSCTQNRFKFASYALGLSCVGLVVFGFALIYWIQEAYEWSEFPANDGNFSNVPLRILKVAAIAGIVVGFLSLVARILNKSVGHFLFGFIALVLVILTVIGAGLLLRDVWQSQINNKYDSNCSENMAPIHENDIKEWCPNKYLPDGQTCRKSDATIRWEDPAKPDATLNPSCCFCVKNYYTWPYQMVGFFAMFFIMCLAICAMTNLYLSDNDDSYGLSKGADPIDYLFLGLAFLALIIFLLYFGFRTGDRSSGNNNASFRAFADKDVNDPDFDRVHPTLKEAAVASGPAVAPGNFGWNPENNPTPTFDASSATCSDANDCISRFAILSRNAEIVPGSVYGTQEGSENARLQFFPDCTNSDNDFKFYYGETDQIASLMKEIQFKPIDGANQDPQALYFVDQVNRNTLSNAGLQSGENPSTTLTAADGANCESGFNEAAAGGTCTGACQYAYKQELKSTTLKGQLFYL